MFDSGLGAYDAAGVAGDDYAGDVWDEFFDLQFVCAEGVGVGRDGVLTKTV